MIRKVLALTAIAALGVFGQHEEEHEHEEGCPPDNPYCHTPTLTPTQVPTSAPSTPYPTFVYTIDFADTVETKVTPDGGTENDMFGFSTAVHHRTAIVGAYGAKDKGENSGAVYVYTTNATKFPYYDDGSTPWEYKQKLLLQHFEQKCDKEGCTWREIDNEAQNSQFGYALAVWNNTIVVGAHRHDMHQPGAGGAYIYTRPSESGLWTMKQSLSPEDAHEYHYFGYSVAVYEDTILLGAAGDEHGGVSSGAAYIYDYDASYAEWYPIAKLTSSNAKEFDNFGCSVDIYKKYAVIGASGDQTLGVDAGAAYVFIKFGSWIQEYKLLPNDGGGERHYFGCSVSIYEETIAVGAYQGHGHWDYAGAVYVYTLQSDGSWKQQTKAIAHDGMSEDKFGYSVSLYKDTLVVGAYGEMAKQRDEPHHVRALEADKKTSKKRRLQPAGPDNNNHNGDEHGENCGPNSPPDCQKYSGEYEYRGASTGSCYVFARSGTSWLQEYKLIADGSQAYDSFGKAVSIHENVLFVGADMADGEVQNTGAAYIYAPPTMSPSTDSTSSEGKTSFLEGSVKFDALVALIFVVIPLAIIGVYYYTNQKKEDLTRHHLPVSTDSQHGSNAPWSMHGAFDDSSRGASSHYGGRGPAPVPTRSPLRGPPVARGL